MAEKNTKDKFFFLKPKFTSTSYLYKSNIENKSIPNITLNSNPAYLSQINQTHDPKFELNNQEKSHLLNSQSLSKKNISEILKRGKNSMSSTHGKKIFKESFENKKYFV